MTWKELKEFCNSLTEEQLENKVILQREDEAVSDIYAEPFEEDQLARDLEGFVSRTTMMQLIKDSPEDYPNKEDDFEIVFKSGTPMLFENF